MIRKHLYITSKQVEFLGIRDELSMAEHVRRALDDYIEKLKGSKASASLSKKEGELNG